MATRSRELERVMDGVLLKASVALMVIDLPGLRQRTYSHHAWRTLKMFAHTETGDPRARSDKFLRIASNSSVESSTCQGTCFLS